MVATSSMSTTTDPSPTIHCQDWSKWQLIFRQHTHRRQTLEPPTRFTPSLELVIQTASTQDTTIRNTNLIFTKFRIDQSHTGHIHQNHQLDLHQVQNWSTRLHTHRRQPSEIPTWSSPSLELVNQAACTQATTIRTTNSIFTKFRIGQPGSIHTGHSHQNHQLHLHQIQNWSVKLHLHRTQPS